KEAEALRGPGHLGEEMRGVRARGETRADLETPHIVKRDTHDTLQGDAPLGGAHQEGILHFLDTTDDNLRSRKNATKGL
ncbi:hypothetical protein A2U01_0097003, partial [Trifolium medium]|nr:hypothetical protein [Trifolium medium]